MSLRDGRRHGRVGGRPISGGLRDAWALRANVAARDVLYVSLARSLRAQFLTTDARLARAVPAPNSRA